MDYRVVSPSVNINKTRHFVRALLVLFASFFIVISISLPASGAVKRAYAGIVVDAKSGKTLYSRAADAKRYPASITKVMTLYILFQELEAGRLKLSTKMRVSKHAANAVPSKLGLRVGSSISVENAIKALVTKSANDVARVIAEHISGTETKFAQRMTKTARSLGMQRTTYRNASGLPNSKQITTVRDQSRLGIAVFQHFPKYYKYFQTRTFKYKGRSYGNYNRLLGQNGIDGIKTGFIRSSGFNLLTAARKNNRHIVVVAFGFDTGNQRNAKVAALVNSYMKKARRGSYVAQARIAKPSIGGTIRVAAVPVTPRARLSRKTDNIPNSISVASLANNLTSEVIIAAPTPAARPINLLTGNETKKLKAPIALASAPPLVSTRVALTTQAPAIIQPNNGAVPIDIIGVWISKRLEPQNNGAMILPPVEIGSEAQTNAIDLLTSGAIEEKKSNFERGWLVQIGTAKTEKEAKYLIASAANSFLPLKNLRPIIQKSDRNGETYYRAKFVGFGNFNQANIVCNQLRKKDLMCLTMQG